MDKLFNNRACLQPQEVTAYLEQSLSEEQRFAIENHLLDCPLCDAAVEGYAQANPELTQQHLEQIQAAIPGLKPPPSATAPSEAKLRRLPRWRNWAAAAAAIALLITAGMIYSNQGPASSAELFAQVYTPYESPFAGTRSGGEEGLPFADGMSAYQDGNYELALQNFNAVLASSPTESIAHLHAGMANLQLEKTEAAIKHLSTVRLNAPVLYGPASWYLALAHLKAGDINSCKAILEQILPTEKEHYPKAQELLKQLNRVKE